MVRVIVVAGYVLDASLFPFGDIAVLREMTVVKCICHLRGAYCWVPLLLNFWTGGLTVDPPSKVQLLFHNTSSIAIWVDRVSDVASVEAGTSGDCPTLGSR